MRFPKIALASAVVMLAAACGGGSEDGGSGGAPDSLTVWVMGTAQDELVNYFDDAESRFQDLYPDTSVNVEFIPWGDAQESITNAIAGGDAPDVLEVGNDQVSSWA